MKKKLSLFIPIFIFLNFSIVFSEEIVFIKILRFINRGLLAYYLTLVFTKDNFNSIDKKRKISKKEFVVSILWALTFLIANYFEYDTFFKIINILPIVMIILMTLEYKKIVKF